MSIQRPYMGQTCAPTCQKHALEFSARVTADEKDPIRSSINMSQYTFCRLWICLENKKKFLQGLEFGFSLTRHFMDRGWRSSTLRANTTLEMVERPLPSLPFEFRDCSSGNKGMFYQEPPGSLEGRFCFGSNFGHSKRYTWKENLSGVRNQVMRNSARV